MVVNYIDCSLMAVEKVIEVLGRSVRGKNKEELKTQLFFCDVFPTSMGHRIQIRWSPSLFGCGGGCPKKGGKAKIFREEEIYRDRYVAEYRATNPV